MHLKQTLQQSCLEPNSPPRCSRREICHWAEWWHMPGRFTSLRLIESHNGKTSAWGLCQIYRSRSKSQRNVLIKWHMAPSTSIFQSYAAKRPSCKEFFFKDSLKYHVCVAKKRENGAVWGKKNNKLLLAEQKTKHCSACFHICISKS